MFGNHLKIFTINELFLHHFDTVLKRELPYNAYNLIMLFLSVLYKHITENNTFI